MNEPVDDAKSQLRAKMKSRLAEMGSDERHSASNAACTRLVNLEAFKHASVIMLYMPLDTEADTTPAAIRCFQLGKTVCVPRVNWKRKDMNAIEVSSFDDRVMDADEHGVRSPREGRLLVPSSINLVIVPGLAFDTHGNRLGRGGGFYDRFLAHLRRSAVTVGFGFDAQVVDSVPVNDGDLRVDYIVTDRRGTPTGRSPSRR